MTDITILGGGPVGLFAAFYAGLRGLSVRIIDSLPELGGQLTALYPEKFIYDMPGFPEILAKDLVENLIKQGTYFNPEIILNETAEVLEGEKDDFVVTTHSGKKYSSRTIVIAAGAGAFHPTKLGILNEDQFLDKGIFYGVKQKSVFNNKDVLVVGGGDSALDWVLELEPITKKIGLVHRRDQFRAHESTVKGVVQTSTELHLWSVVKEIYGEEFVKAVTLENLKTKEITYHEIDALVVNIGYKASLGAIRNWNLEIEKNHILVNDYLETIREGVYSIGDIASYVGKIKLLAVGMSEAATVICAIKTKIDSTAKLFPGHSSDMNLYSVN